MPKGIYIRSEETKQILSDAHKGHKLSEETKRKMSIATKGRQLSQEHKRKIGLSQLGSNNHSFGKIDEKSYVWKGENINYATLHSWVKKKLGQPRECWNPNCLRKSATFDWANKSHKYLRILSDWIRLCRSCHMLYDKGKLVI